MQEHPHQNGANKNLAKKTGKSTLPSASLVPKISDINGKVVNSQTPDIDKFMEEYQKTMLRNLQVDWLNGVNDQFIKNKEDDKKPSVTNVSIPPFLKPNNAIPQPNQIKTNVGSSEAGNTQTYQQKLAKARVKFIQQSSCDASSNKINQPANSNNNQNTNNSQTSTNISLTNTVKTIPNNQLKQEQLQRQQQQRQIKKDTNQPQRIDLTKQPNNPTPNNPPNNNPTFPTNNSIANNIFNRVNNSSSQPSSNQQSFANQSNSNFNQQISYRPTIPFNNNAFITQNTNSNQTNNLSPIFQNNRQQVQNSPQPNNMNFNPDLSKAGFKRQTWKCAQPYMDNANWVKHRNDLSNGLKNKTNIDDKMIDMLAVMTYSQAKTMPMAQIQQKRLSIKTLALTLQDAKQQQSQIMVKYPNSAEDRRLIGYNLQDFIENYQDLTPKTIKYNSQQQVNQLLKDESILKYYKSIQNETVQAFLSSYEAFYQASNGQFEFLTSKMIQLMEDNKKITAQLDQLRQQKQQGQVQAIFDQIEEKQQNILTLLNKLVDRLGTRFENLPKNELNYEFQEIKKFESQEQHLIEQIKSCSIQLQQSKQGHPYKQVTNLLCESTSYLAHRVAHIENIITAIQEHND